MAVLSSNDVTRVLSLAVLSILNACAVESRRRHGNRRYSSGTAHTGGADPLPWWAITLIFVGGVLSIFLCFLGFKKLYEKKRQQKLRTILSRRRATIERRRSGQLVTNSTGAVGHGGEVPRAADAPPTYDQSVLDSLPPVYYQEVTDVDPSAQQPRSPAPEAPVNIAPPSYEAAQCDGSEVVEVGANGETREPMQ